MSSGFRWFDSWEDSAQVEKLRETLPEILRYEGEFGPEIVSFIPFVFNLHIRGMLENRQISTYIGMKPFYYFSPRKKLIERSENRIWVPPLERWWPNSDEHIRQATHGEHYPHYSGKANKKKRIIFIQNKYSLEWRQEPINFLSLELLDAIFQNTKDNYHIIYSRQGISKDESKLGISIDHNIEEDFQDFDLCQKYRHVKILERSKLFNLRSYNSEKLYWISRASYLAGVQGGSNTPWAYFSKPALILHKHGRETEFSYLHGYYKYLSDPPLDLRVVHTDGDFITQLLGMLNSKN